MLALLGRYLRLLAIWAMVLPFVGTSLIANGVMPTTSANGVIMMVFCSDDGMVEIAVDAVTLEPQSDNDDGGAPGKKSDHCAFAAVHADAQLPIMVALRAPDGPELPRAELVSATTLRAAAKTGLPPATGPPATL